MALKASLKIQLFADTVVVAESEDEGLWRRVLAAIQGAGNVANGETDDEMVNEKDQRQRGKGLDGLAAELGTDKTALVGACDPSKDAPYIQMDSKCWEAFKRNTPPRGPNSVSGITLAGTLLCLWFTQAGIEGRPTQAQAKQVLDAVGASDKNPSRAIKNCTWLQSRGGGLQINPSEVSKAHAVAKAFVTKKRVGGGASSDDAR